MPSKELKNKPLVEAIFELRWAPTSQSALGQSGPALPTDSHYKLLLGRFYEKVMGAYPEHEALPTSMIPEEMVWQSVQHRFRHGPNDWPVLQLGPGIMTTNETDKYLWDSFRGQVLAAVSHLYASYPNPSGMRIESLLLRYIDALDFDYESNDLLTFLRDKLKVNVSVPGSLFDGKNVVSQPSAMTWRANFASKIPPGVVGLGVATGKSGDRPAILLETTVQTSGNDLPPMPGDLGTWLDKAHTITHDWFFKLIAGELEERFSRA